MKITIQPTRNRNGRWQPCTFAEAQAFELRSQRGKRLARVTNYARAKALAGILDTNHSRKRRSPDARLGARYSTVQEEVASRRAYSGTAKPIAKSLTEREYQHLTAMGTTSPIAEGSE